jgi:hypothetical protein
MPGPRHDIPARIVAAAAAWLPAHRRDWGRAMTAELAQVHGLAGRWRFAAGALRVALFLPSGRGRRMLAVALVGLLAAAAVTAAAAAEIPGLATSAAVFCLLLGGYATFRASRPRPPRRTAPGVMVAVLALATVTAAIVSVARIAVAHPAAAADSTHVFAVLFAVALAGYLAVALTPSSPAQATAAERQAQRQALCWALAAALAAGAVWTVIDLTTSVKPVGITGYLWPVGAAAVLAASVGAAAATGSAPAGVRAGLLTAVLTAPMHFAADLTALVQAGHYTLTTSYDVAAFPHSGYPDVASYLLSDSMGGDVLVGLVLYPLVLCLLALAAVTLVGSGVGRGSGDSVTSMLR